MKLVYLIAGTYRAAGMERVLALKANYLASKGYEILIVTTDQEGRPPAFDFNPDIRFEDLAIGYERTNGKSIALKLLTHPFKLLRHKSRLSSLLKKEKADIVISMFCNDFSFVPSIRDGSRKILEAHFSRLKRLQYDRKGLWALADRVRYKHEAAYASRYDRLVILTQEDKENWEGLDNLMVIPNPCPFSFSTSAQIDSHRMLAVGRYCYQKGFNRLIEAWKLIDTDGWTLRIAGEGDLKELVNEGGTIPGNVILGRSDDIQREYLDASIFVLSSHNEGLPMALLEAQAAGLPSVCFRCKCGPADIIDDGTDGFLVEEGDIRGLGEAMSRLMTDVDLRRKMGAAALANSKRFNLNAIMDKWEKLFEELS